MDIANLTNERVEGLGLHKLVDAVLEKEGYEGKSNLSLLLAGEALMASLSKKWLDKDHASNVLAFPGGELALGEIVLCPLVIRKDAREYGITYRDAFRLMVVHGLLHLLGYGHQREREEKKMKAKENCYLNEL